MGDFIWDKEKEEWIPKRRTKEPKRRTKEPKRRIPKEDEYSEAELKVFAERAGAFPYG